MKLNRLHNLCRLEFHIAYACSNQCVFCSEARQIRRFPERFIPLRTMLQSLKEFNQQDKGFVHCTFTGGEPTLNPGFLEALIFAKKAGYTTAVTTNGGRFSSAAFMRKAAPYIDEICFSLHGHTAQLHDLHTRHNGSFDNLLVAYANLSRSRLPISVMVNTVMTQYNYRWLVRISQMASGFKLLKQHLFSNLAPEGGALGRYRELVVGLKDIKAALQKIIRVKPKDVAVRFFGLPLCVFSGHPEYSNDSYWTPRVTIELERRKGRQLLRQTVSMKPVRKRMQPPSCGRCARRHLCSGVFIRYYREFGDSELVPFIKGATDA